jgi:multidrug efflux pump subunit AcrA (membrane-fusion protein)
VYAQKVTILSSEINGVVKEILCQPQDFVKKGDVLIQLDDELVRLEIQSTKSKIELSTSEDKARVNLEYARDNLAIIENLYNTKAGEFRVGSPKELKEAEQRKEMAVLGETEAKLEMTILKLSLQHNQILLRKHQVKAPMDGVLVPLASLESLRVQELKQVETGEAVQVGNPVTAMMKVDQLRVQHQLPVDELDTIRLGQKVRVYVRGGSEQGEPAQVVFINPVVDSVGLVNIDVEFSNPPVESDTQPKGTYLYRYRPGMKARVEILSDS